MDDRAGLPRARAWFVSVAVVWSVLGSNPGWAQEAKQQVQNRVTITNTFGGSDEELRVPLYISANPDAAIRQVALELAVPSVLKFVSIEPGFLAENAGLRIVARQLESAVAIDVQASGKTGKEAVPSGLIGYLIFKAVADVEKDAPVDVSIRKLSMVGARGETLEIAEKSTAVVTIRPAGAPPLIACFFYMH